MKSVRSKLIEDTVSDNKNAIERLSFIEKQEQQINDLISLSIWSIRRLHKDHQIFGYKELISVVGRKHVSLLCVKDELERLGI